MAEILEVPVDKFDSELEKIIRQSNTFEKRFKQYDFQNLDWNDGEVTAAESGIIVGGIGIVFLLIFLLIRGSVNNRKSRSHVPKPDRKQRFLNDPDLNCKDWEVHRERLDTFGRSQYRGTMFYVGPKGGVYYITYRGTKVYC